MKIIDKITGIDIMRCENIDNLRNILIDNIANTYNLMEEYGFFLLKCHKKGMPLINSEDWLKIRNK